MDTLIHVTGEQMIQVLETACDHDLTLDISRHDDAERAVMKTHFAARLPDGRVAVRVPTRDGTPVLMKANEEVFITFNLHDQPYQFSSAICGRDMMAISDELRLPVLLLTAPPHIERIQRRSCFRVKLSSVRRKLGNLWIIQELPPENQLRARPIGQVEIADLSAKGAGLLVSPEQAQVLQPQTDTILALPLDDPSQFIRVQAQIRSARPTAKGPWHIGLQFVGLEETADGRALGQLIEHHVVALERDELQRLKRKV